MERQPALARCFVFSALVMMVGCGPSAREAAPAVAPSQPAGPRGTLKIAWGAEPSMLAGKILSPGSTSLNEVAVTFNSALTYTDSHGASRPQIAAEIPTIENGGWVVNPDGSMVTTYRLREHARWHDGAPLTARDFVFAYQVYIDPLLPVARRDPERLMASVEAADDHTLVIRWKGPYYAPNVLRYQQLDPLPEHILRTKLDSSKEQFLTGVEWSTSYVGSGPFKLDRWDLGQGLIASAFMDWVLGPPKVAVLDIRFINSPEAILANLLAGEIDLSGLPWTTPTGAESIRERWVGGGLGTIVVTESRLQYAGLQLREVPNWQSALADVRVRQALLHGIDREALALANFAPSGADVFLAPSDPLFPEVTRTITHIRSIRPAPPRGLPRLAGDGCSLMVR